MISLKIPLGFSEVKDMETLQKRPPLFTNKMLVAMTIPIILDALLTIAAGMVDSAMVSSAGEAAVSAVSLVDAINLLFLLRCALFFFLTEFLLRKKLNLQ